MYVVNHSIKKLILLLRNKNVMHRFLLFIMMIFQISAFTQTDYYVKDSASFSGVNMVEGTDYENSRLCKIKADDKTISYTPNEVKEYGFKNGRIYIAKDIPIGDSSVRVFLEILTANKTALLYYKGKRMKTFFIAKDSTFFIEIPKQSKDGKTIVFRAFLNNAMSDCPNIKDPISVATYKKKALTKIIDRYDECIEKPFPFFKYGLNLSYGFSKLLPNTSDQLDYYNLFDYRYEPEYSFGLFLDKPISFSDFSFHFESNLSKVGYSYNFQMENKDIDLLINTTSLNIPLLIKYSLPLNKVRPFFDAGMVYCYNFKNEQNIYEALINDSVIQIYDVSNNNLITDNQTGYVIGMGMEIKLRYRNSLFFELRHSRLFSIQDEPVLHKSVFQLLTSINF